MAFLVQFCNIFSNVRLTYLLQGYAVAAQENHKYVSALYDGSYYAFLMK